MAQLPSDALPLNSRSQALPSLRLFARWLQFHACFGQVQNNRAEVNGMTAPQAASAVARIIAALTQATKQMSDCVDAFGAAGPVSSNFDRSAGCGRPSALLLCDFLVLPHLFLHPLGRKDACSVSTRPSTEALQKQIQLKGCPGPAVDEVTARGLEVARVNLHNCSQ
jgi:hypothetical protein